MLERIWTVSTLLSLSRIALVVPFAVCLLVDFPNHRLWAAAVIAAGVVTDFLDGYLARRRHEVTDLGKIVDPIAVFQGDIDRVVPREQSDTIVASLRSRGVPHEYHVYEGEGHGWRKTETIEKFYDSVQRFLTQYVLFA